MKLKTFIVLFLTFCSTGYVLAQNHIFVLLHSGETIYYKLEDNPTITYSSTELNIHTGKNSPKSIPIHDVKEIRYTAPKNISVSDGIQTGHIAVYSAFGYYITIIKEFEDIYKLYLPMGVYILQSKDSSKKVLLQ